MKDIKVCTKFETHKVEVPIIFLGTVGFSLRRDGRYSLVFIGSQFSVGASFQWEGFQ
jgi:hypothetical protein